MEWKIPVTGERALDGAAMYLCLLAYPDDEEKRRDTFKACAALRARGYRKHRQHVGIDEGFSERVRPLLKHCAPRDMWNRLGMLNKQVIGRLRAAALLGYFGVSEFVKPGRRVSGIYPRRFVAEQILRVTPDGTLTATDALRTKPDSLTPQFKVIDENDLRSLQLIDPSRVRAATYSDLLRAGAKRWHMTEHSVGAIILGGARHVPHMALALRETMLRRREATADILDLLACPGWVLPCVEDTQIIGDSWAANASVYPTWRKFDPDTFIKLRSSL